MKFRFSEKKAAEAAGHLLRLAGGKMPYIKLIKLMYFADRRTLVEIGAPITGDRLVAMPHGPVLSQVLDNINQGASAEWAVFVSEPRDWNVELVSELPEDGALSNYEIRVLREVHQELGHLDKWALVKRSHELPEWHDPHGSAEAITPEDILRTANMSEEAIARIAEEADAVWSMGRPIAPLQGVRLAD